MSDTITKFNELAEEKTAHEKMMEEWKINEEAIDRRRTIIEANGNSAIHYNLDGASSSSTTTLTNTDSLMPNFNGFIYGGVDLEEAFTNPVELEEDKTPDFKTVTDSIADLLKYKNLKYGNAALEPMSIFEGKTKVGQRLDDKLARVKNGEELKKNDIADLIGYLTLVCIENNWSNFDEFKD